jgi:hypothetical protein
LVVLGLAVTGCTQDKLSPAEARRARVEQRLRRTFSQTQTDCILDRVDTAVLIALDKGGDLEPATPQMFTYSNALAICVTDPDGSTASTTTSSTVPGTTAPGDATTTTSTTTPTTGG